VPVCITGMHRSGTSAVAHALSLCGVDFGPADQLIPGNEWNKDGYWENMRIVELDDWLLEQLGGSWDIPPEAAAAKRSDLRASFEARAQQLFADLDLQEPYGWKDPRASLVADFWRDAFPGTRFVVVVRSPVEVALSLRRRAASSALLSLSLWSTYYSELLAHVPAAERVVVDHGALLADPAATVARLVAALGLDATPEMQREASAVVDSAQRHHVADEAALEGLPQQLAGLYAQLLAESRGEGVAEPAPSQLAKPKPAAGHAESESDLAALVAAQQERDALRGEVKRLTADRDHWRERAEALEPERVRLQADRDAWRTEARHWRSETARLVAVEQRRLRPRLRQARLRYARRLWRLLPAGVRNKLRPLIFRGGRHEFIRPEPLEKKDEASPAKPPGRPPAQRRRGAATLRQPIDVPVSVVVPTFNAGTDAALFLAALERQVGVPELELVVADSGSTDGTRERFAAAADVMLDIPAGEFGHGRTRNAAFAASSGDAVVMMVQDALLLGPHALHDLVHELLSGDALAAVSARQVARSDADLYGAYIVATHHNALWRDGRNAKPSDPLYRRAAAGVDDVCAAIRRSAWESLQYRDVEFGEDLDFGMRAIEAGWTIGLSDDVAVAHSHTRDAPYQFRRSVADCLNIAPLVGESSVSRSATAAADVAEIAAAGVALLGDVAASLALSGESDERLSQLFERIAERAVTPLTTMKPSRGQLGLLAEFLAEIANGAEAGAASAPLRWEFAAHLRRPLLVEFADAQRAPSPDAVADFVAKLAAIVIGHSVGDRLRIDESIPDRERLLVGV
jgi:GT2 family glycosyltransferase